MADEDFQKIYENTYQNIPAYIAKLVTILDENDKTEKIVDIMVSLERLIKQYVKEDEQFALRWKEYLESQET